MATPAQRAHLKALMRWLEAHEPQVHYAQRRPMATRAYYTPGGEQRLANVLAEQRGSLTMDCSEGVTLLCALAGLADPNGRSYSGNGYTGTMLGHLPHYTNPAGADVGALVVYGPDDGDHVSMVYEPGRDPLLWSHGSEGGPRFVDFSEQRSEQRAPARFLSIARL